MKLSHRDIVNNHKDSSKEEIKQVQMQGNKTVVNNCDEMHKD